MLPQDVVKILETLTDAGHTAWCVGGCVRDALLGRTPDDYDVATSARPEQVCALFGPQAIPTGLRHGTVTVFSGSRAVEVTTYRRDGSYSDHRHPDSVAFSDTLAEDLRRRDFTVNAMAEDASGALCDPFGGQSDLKRKTLRCVGDPDARFREDALRILRCLRFSSMLDFAVEPDTAAAVHRCRAMLSLVAAERIQKELCALLCGRGAARVLREYPDVLGVILPEILPCVGFAQHNRYHCFDVWEHTLRSVAAAEPERRLRMAMLLHDLGKPACFTMDSRGDGHFYGHPAVSRELAETILRRLKFDRSSQSTISVLVEWHDRPVQQSERSLRRALRALGEERLRLLLKVKRADNLAQAPETWEVQEEITRGEALLDSLVRDGACFSLGQLAVRGGDLMRLGLRGRAVGETLDALLSAVVDGELPNERAALLAAAEKRIPGGDPHGS